MGARAYQDLSVFYPESSLVIRLSCFLKYLFVNVDSYPVGSIAYRMSIWLESFGVP
jgi:hypothetical protein